MTRPSRISVSCRAEGSHGPLQTNPNPDSERRIRMRLVGTVLSAADSQMWNVSFDFDGKTKAVHLLSLKIVSDRTAIPVNEITKYNKGSFDIVENSPEVDIGPESEMKENSNTSISNSNPAQQDEETEENEDVLYPKNDFCFTEDDFLEAQINMNEATRHTSTYNLAWSKIRALEGDIVECRNQDSVFNWKIVSNVEEDVFEDRKEAETKRMKDVFFPIKNEGIG